MKVTYTNDISRGPGYGILRCTDTGTAGGECSFSLCRASDQAFLGSHGEWLDTQTFLVPSGGARMEGADLLLAIGPDVVNQLSMTETYRLHLKTAETSLKAGFRASNIIYAVTSGAHENDESGLGVKIVETETEAKPAAETTMEVQPPSSGATPGTAPEFPSTATAPEAEQTGTAPSQNTGTDPQANIPPHRLVVAPPISSRNKSYLLPVILVVLVLLAAAAGGLWWYLGSADKEKTPETDTPEMTTAAPEQKPQEPAAGEPATPEPQPEEPVTPESSAEPEPTPEEPAASAAPEPVQQNLPAGEPASPEPSAAPEAQATPAPAPAPASGAPAPTAEEAVLAFFGGKQYTPAAAAELSRTLPKATRADQDAVYRLYYFAGENGEASVLMDYAACLDPSRPAWGSIQKDPVMAWDVYEKAKAAGIAQAEEARQGMKLWLQQKASSGDAQAIYWLRSMP